MDRHGPIHVGEGQAVALIGEDLGGVRWRTSDKAATNNPLPYLPLPLTGPNNRIADSDAVFRADRL
jgi:hypothetical protein